MIYCNTLDYKGHRLSYFVTNHGTLFLARGLLALYKEKSYCTSPLEAYFDMALTVKLPTGGSKPPICVGLNGYKKLFKDKPDDTLEQILISKGIIQGELPATEDIKVKACYNNNGSCVVHTDDHSLNSSRLSEIRQLREGLAQEIKRNHKLQQEIILLQKRLKIYQHLYPDTMN